MLVIKKKVQVQVLDYHPIPHWVLALLLYPQRKEHDFQLEAGAQTCFWFPPLGPHVEHQDSFRASSFRPGRGKQQVGVRLPSFWKARPWVLAVEGVSGVWGGFKDRMAACKAG